MLLLKENTSSLTLESLPGYFQIVRDAGGFAVIVRTGTQYQTNRYRFRHHGDRKFLHLMEPVPGTGYGRITLSASAARDLVRSAARSGRAEVFTEQGDGRWTLSVKAVSHEGTDDE